MTAALLRWWAVPRFNVHSNQSNTYESSAAKNQTSDTMFNKLNQKVSLDNVDVNLLQLVRHR